MLGCATGMSISILLKKNLWLCYEHIVQILNTYIKSKANIHFFLSTFYQ